MADAAAERPLKSADALPRQGEEASFDQDWLRDFRKRHPPLKVETMTPEAYRRVIEEFLTLAGTEPDLVAPPRRRFD